LACHSRVDRQSLVLPHHDAAAGGRGDCRGAGRRARRSARARRATPHRNAARDLRRPPAPRSQAMTPVLHRRTGPPRRVAVGGRAIGIVGSEGGRYLAASGGAAVSCLGHGHPDVIAALREQLDTIAYAHTGFFTTEVAERLADRLIADAPPG